MKVFSKGAVDGPVYLGIDQSYSGFAITAFKDQTNYYTEVATWGVNQAKWKAAEEYCMDRGWEFRVITEDHLGL